MDGLLGVGEGLWGAWEAGPAAGKDGQKGWIDWALLDSSLLLSFLFYFFRKKYKKKEQGKKERS